MELKDFGINRQEIMLSSGAKLVLFERKGAPVYIRASFFAGSRFDPVGKEGTAHFLEHMLVAGTKKFPTKDKLAAYIEQYGGVFSASTSGDTINVNVSVGDSQDMSRTVEVLHEMLLEPLFEEKTFETERGSILKELGDKKSNPDSMIWELWRKLFFQGTVFGRSILGTEESINSITKDNILNFYNSKILSGEMVFVASGGVEILDLKKEIEAKVALGKLGLGVSFKEQPILRNKQVIIEPYKDRDQVYLLFGFRCVSGFNPDVPVLDILGEVLGGGRASVLQRKLRYEKGLVYGAGAWQQTFSDCGNWAVETSTSKDKLNEVLNIVIGEIERVCEQGLTPGEVKFAQDKIEKSKRMEMQTSSSWVNFHSFRELFKTSQPWTLIDYISEIKAVTPEMTREVAQKYFGPDKWYLAICGDIEESEIKVDW